MICGSNEDELSEVGDVYEDASLGRHRQKVLRRWHQKAAFVRGEEHKEVDTTIVQLRSEAKQ